MKNFEQDLNSKSSKVFEIFEFFLFLPSVVDSYYALGWNGPLEIIQFLVLWTGMLPMFYRWK